MTKPNKFAYVASTLLEPSSYEKPKDIPEWELSMKVEFDALVRNNTWTLISKPKSCKQTSSKWIYKVKLKSACSLDKYKCRVVAKSYK